MLEYVDIKYQPNGNVVVTESDSTGVIMAQTVVPAAEWNELKAANIRHLGNASYSELIGTITGILIALESK